MRLQAPIPTFAPKKLTMTKPPKIWLSSPHMGPNEEKYVSEAFASNWIAPLGPHVNGFEADISQYLQGSQEEAMHTAVLTSGTAAIHLGLVMLGVQPGDAVLTQSFTFCGSANPIAYLGARPVFIDSEPSTWNMNPQALRAALEAYRQKGQMPKAIIPVHLYGMPARMDEIQALAREYEVPILEDAAEALGSTYGSRPCGSLGEIAALSFNGNKIITTSGGGALVSPFGKYAEQARFLSTQARDQAPHYQHSQIGYNYRMSNVVAGIGRGQMEVLDERVAARRANNQRYRRYFEGNSGITFQNEPSPDFYSNYWLTTILVNPQHTGGLTREDLRLGLEQYNIEARPLWKPMHLQPVFAEAPYYTTEGLCPQSTPQNSVSDHLFEQGLCLPSGSNLTENDWQRIESALDEVLDYRL